VLGVDVPIGAVYLNFAMQGMVWLIISGCFLILSKHNATKLQRLKQEGDCYDGTVEALRPIYGVRLMHYITTRADCSYLNSNGKKCLVRSKAFMIDGVGLLAHGGASRFTQGMIMDIAGHAAHDFIAQVYVNRSDPTDYAIEIMKPLGTEIEADYDYR